MKVIFVQGYFVGSTAFTVSCYTNRWLTINTLTVFMTLKAKNLKIVMNDKKNNSCRERATKPYKNKFDDRSCFSLSNT